MGLTSIKMHDTTHYVHYDYYYYYDCEYRCTTPTITPGTIITSIAIIFVFLCVSCVSVYHVSCACVCVRAVQP